MKTKIAVLTGFLVLFMTACFNFNGGGEATVTLNLGGGSRANAPWPPDDPTNPANILDQLKFTVQFSGPGNRVFLATEGREKITATVNSGTWNIEVKAFYNGDLYAEGSARELIKAGNNLVTVRMSEAGGKGTLTDPFLVYDEATLRKVGSGQNGWDLDKHYEQTENITLNGNWVSIGFNSTTGPFSGSYDGKGYAITGLTTSGSSDPGGLFSEVSGTVRNVKLSVSINSLSDDVGGVVGTNNGGRVENCHVSGNVTGNTTTGSTITGGVGGVVGLNGDGGTIQDCSFSGNVTSARNNVGGVVGANVSDDAVIPAVIAKVKNCYAAGNVTGVDNVGGVAGANAAFTGLSVDTSAMIENCYATGNVTGVENVGGIVGSNYAGNMNAYTNPSFRGKATVQNCYATANVKGDKSVGGIVGDNNGNDNGTSSYIGTVEILYCYATGSVVAGVGQAGGIVGYHDGNGGSTVQNCVALNQKVTMAADGLLAPEIGRVVGHNVGTIGLTNNYGKSGMDVLHNTSLSGTQKSIVDSMTGVDGDGITQAEYDDSGWWTDTDSTIPTPVWFRGEAWDAAVWDIQNGRLPILKDMPAGTQNPTVQ